VPFVYIQFLEFGVLITKGPTERGVELCVLLSYLGPQSVLCNVGNPRWWSLCVEGAASLKFTGSDIEGLA
jgi:hypothetical protein